MENLSTTYVSRKEKVSSYLLEVQRSLIVQQLKYNQPKKFTDVGFQEATIVTNPFMVVLHHWNDVHVISGCKRCRHSCKIGMLKHLVLMVEDWPPKTSLCGFQRISLLEGFLHCPKHLVFGFSHKLFMDFERILYTVKMIRMFGSPQHSKIV